ncbi:hypothetical protein [Tenacibaculum ovolyticum]|uniref:hypothetical protein n=1 Tax=Tenacibaculum ovolyticum TaxID=104270 RepID=UPI003BABCE9F
MKKILLLGALILYLNSFAQSTNLDRERFHVSYVELPSDPILDDSKRTYSINISGVSINGFSKVKSPGVLDINYIFTGTRVGEVKIDKEKHQKKDKDGNILSTWYTYKVKTNYSSRGILNIVNGVKAKSYEEKFSAETDYTSNSFNSYYKAERYYALNKYDIKDNHKRKHKSIIKRNIKSYLDSRYGYIPYSTNSEFLWILASKKHPETKKHHEAYNKVKAIFSRMSYDEPMDDIAKELEPVIAYFENVISRYPGTKRKMRKVKYASYYNLAKIYSYLDMPQKVEEYAGKLIENDYDKSDGNSFLRTAVSLSTSLEKNNMKSRHMKIVTEDISNLEEEKKEEVPEFKANQEFELNQAYLITKENDTTLVDINTKDIEKIGYSFRNVQYNKNGSPIGTRVKQAKGCKELLFVEGLHYKNIVFKEASKKPGSVKLTQGVLGGVNDKLCRVLFESDKINLYKFNNKELVIVMPESEKGKSTSAMGFVFAFKKKLAKIAEDCPEVAKKAMTNRYKNNEISLLKFCNDLTNCKTE